MTGNMKYEIRNMVETTVANVLTHFSYFIFHIPRPKGVS